MDVNTIINDLNNVNKYNNYDMTQTNVADNNIKVSSSLNDEKDKNTESNSSNSNTDQKKLDSAINKLNKFMEDDKTHAEYSVFKELNTVMVKIIDDKTKKVIVEVPSEKILAMVAKMCEDAGLIDKKA